MDNQGTPTAAPKRILCIEDEHFISELYTRALTKAGYLVDVQLDGQKGMAAAQTDVYDIILLDLMIPNITGIEVLRTLRDPRQTPKMHAKIVITTNLEQREDIRADIEKQADGYLVKAEITPKELVEFLSHLDF
jgi:DNA-binding response OmpR family regulator